ncbi:hypothetical protein NEIPOLOT_02609 [Neisseria polysaccharea ATCC 43768]|nr:hypothetical protein NEIPOLOT_02609 [Neisseria polysaccharea ATCC 43768]
MRGSRQCLKTKCRLKTLYRYPYRIIRHAVKILPSRSKNEFVELI